MTIQEDLNLWCHNTNIAIDKLKNRQTRIEAENVIILIFIAGILAKLLI